MKTETKSENENRIELQNQTSKVSSLQKSKNFGGGIEQKKQNLGEILQELNCCHYPVEIHSKLVKYFVVKKMIISSYNPTFIGYLYYSSKNNPNYQKNVRNNNHIIVGGLK